jgi:hypothetical protein
MDAPGAAAARARGAALVPADYPVGLIPVGIRGAIEFRARAREEGDAEAYWQATGMLEALRALPTTAFQS